MEHVPNNLVIMLCGAYSSLIYQTPRVRTARLFDKLVYLQFKSDAVNFQFLTAYSPLTVEKLKHLCRSNDHAMKWTSTKVKVFRFQEGARDISLLYSVRSGFGSQRSSIQQAMESLSLEV